MTSVYTLPGNPGLVLYLTAGTSDKDAAFADRDFILEAKETVLVVGETEFSFDDAVLSHSDTTGDNAEYTGVVIATWTEGQAGLVAGETVAFHLLLRNRPEEAQFTQHETHLVKNTGQTALTTGGLLGVDAENEAQGFITGPNPGGYTLSALGISFRTIADTANAGSELTVSLYDATPHEFVPTLLRPNSALCTLNDPSTFSSSGVQTFTAPATCPTLATNTLYYVVLERAVPANLDYFPTNRQIFYDVTFDNDEDAGAAEGWSIEATAWYFQDGFWQDETSIPTHTVKMMIEVQGAPVLPSYLVKNTGQTSLTSGEGLDATTIKGAQAFTTGAGAYGYALSSIGIDFHTLSNVNTAGSHLAVTLNAVASNGIPGASLCALADPSSFTGSGVQTFDSPVGCPTLEASTSYFVVIERVQATTDTIQLSLTSSNSEDTGGAAGWLVGNGRYSLDTGGSWVDSTSDPYQIEIKGVARTAADPRNLGFNTLEAAGNDRPHGIWSDGTTMWVVHSPNYQDADDTSSAKIYAYNLATKARDSTKDFDTLDAAGNDHPRDLWSDGSTMWVTDHDDDKTYAYNMDTKARTPGEDFSTASNGGANGIWSDGTIIWVANRDFRNIDAYGSVSKLHQPDDDFNSDPLFFAGVRVIHGIWSDGTTMFVTDWHKKKIFAFWLSSKLPDRARDIDLSSADVRPDGIWSDGTTMWVSSRDDSKIYAYELPPPSPEPETDMVSVDRITADSALVTVDLRIAKSLFGLGSDNERYSISMHILFGGHTIFAHPDASTAQFMLRGMDPDTEYSVEVKAQDTLSLGTVAFTTASRKLSGIEASNLTHSTAKVTVSLEGADIDKRAYINYWVGNRRSDPESTWYLRYKRETDSAFSGWSDPVTLTFSGSTDVALSELDPGTVYDVQVYEDHPGFTQTPPSFRPVVYAEGTWLEELGAFATPPLPPTLALEAEMTVGLDTANQFDGFSVETGSLSATTFEVGGVEYTVKQAGILTVAPASWAFLVDPALPFDSFTLTVDSTELQSSNATTVDGSNGRQYLWSATDPNWTSGTKVAVKLDVGLINICKRSPAVAYAIKEATPSFDFCHMTSLLDLDDLTELRIPNGRGAGLRVGDFEGLSGLTHLDLSWYMLGNEGLSVGVFDGLDSLTHLDISHTSLLSLNRDVFDGLSNLEVLDLSDTRLQAGTVPVGVFDDLGGSLEVLRLTNESSVGGGVYRTSFSVLHDDFFDGLADLRELDLGDSDPLRDSPLSLWPLTALETYNGQPYTRPAAQPQNLDYSSGRIEHRLELYSTECYTVTLRWNPPSGVSGITGYRILRNLGNESLDRYARQIAEIGADARTYVDGRGADVCFGDDGIRADYYVAAITADGDSFPTRYQVTQTSRSFQATQVPDAPTLSSSLYDFSVASNPNGYRVRLEWNNTHHNITGYEIQYRPTGSGNWQTLVANTGNVLRYDNDTVPVPPTAEGQRTEAFIYKFNAFRDENPLPHTRDREFRIRAINAHGNSGWSNVVRPFR